LKGAGAEFEEKGEREKKKKIGHWCQTNDMRYPIA
jgi:hypothetical protein